jgi:hypothetical protein
MYIILRILIQQTKIKCSLLAGPYYLQGAIGTVPRAYEGMEGRKIKIKNEEIGKLSTK